MTRKKEKKEAEVKEGLFCPLCKKGFEENDALEAGTCPNCGRRPSEATMELESKTREEAAHAIAEKGEGTTCKKCGLVNEKGRVTCRLCGETFYRGKPKKAPSKEKKAATPKAPKEKKEKKAAKEKVKPKLKYEFDTLNKGQSLTIPHADGKAGKVTICENVKVLAREYGQRHGVQFKVEETEGKKVLVTRIA